MPEFDDYAQRYAELLRDPIRDAFAPQGGFFMERKWQLLTRFLRRAGVPANRASWLDVGCGQGDLLKIGAPHLAHATGCDLSPEMLRQCDGLDVRLQTEPAQLPFEDARFDLVTAVCVYHHVEAPVRGALTAELARVLKPGGFACIIEHNPFNPATQVIVRRTPVDADAHLLTAGRARRLLRSAGLRVARTAYFLYFPENLYRRLGFLENWAARIPAGGQFAVFARRSGVLPSAHRVG